MLLALLSKPYRYVPSKFGVKSEKSPVTSSLLITPHRDLAFQCLHWIKSIHSHVPSSNLSSIAQVLVRGAPNFPSDQLSLLQKTPPLILMGTPQAFLEILEKDPHALRLRTLSTVVVDEADYLIEYMPLAADKYDRIKYQRTLKNHPSPTRQILDYIYCPNRFYNVDRKGKKYEDPKRSIPEQEFGFRRPQLVLSSATLKAQLRRSLMMEAGWLTQVDGDLAKISGKGGERPSQEVLATNALGGRSMVHCALVVYEDGSIKNIGSAVEADPKSSNTVVVDDGEGNVNQGEEGDRTLVDVETEEGGSVADVGMSGVEEEKGVALVSEEDEAGEHALVRGMKWKPIFFFFLLCRMVN